MAIAIMIAMIITFYYWINMLISFWYKVSCYRIRNLNDKLLTINDEIIW